MSLPSCGILVICLITNEWILGTDAKIYGVMMPMSSVPRDGKAEDVAGSLPLDRKSVV